MQSKISKRAVDSLAPADASMFLWDTEVKGFGVKATLAGKKIYILQYRVAGRQRRYTIGTHGSPWTPEKARQEAIRLLGLVAEGKDPAETKAQAVQTLTVAGLCDEYIAEGVTIKKPSTVTVDKSRIERHIKPLLGRKRIDIVTQADIERFQQSVASGATAIDVKTEGGRSIVTGGKGAASHCVGLLGAIFTFAVRRKYVSENPVHGVKKFPDQRMERFLTVDEFSRLGDSLREAEVAGANTYAINAIRLLLLTGMRLGEVLKLEWSHVAFERQCLMLPDSKTQYKIVQVGGAALQLLAELDRVGGNPFCFPGGVPGRHLVNINRAWHSVREAAGIEDCRLHDLRHGFASVGAMSGMGLPIIGKLLGHSQASTTQRYAHLADDPVKLAADRISSQIAAALDRKPMAEVVKIRNGG